MEDMHLAFTLVQIPLIRDGAAWVRRTRGLWTKNRHALELDPELTNQPLEFRSAIRNGLLQPRLARFDIAKLHLQDAQVFRYVIQRLALALLEGFQQLDALLHTGNGLLGDHKAPVHPKHQDGKAHGGDDPIPRNGFWL